MKIREKLELWKIKRCCKKKQIRMLLRRESVNIPIIIDDNGEVKEMIKLDESYYEYNNEKFSYKYFNNSRYLDFINRFLNEIEYKTSIQSEKTIEELNKQIIIEDIKIETITCKILLNTGAEINKKYPNTIELSYDKDYIRTEEDKEKEEEYLKRHYYGKVIYEFNVKGVETDNLYYQNVSLIVENVMDFPFLLTESHIKTILKNYYKEIAVSLKDFIDLMSIFNHELNFNGNALLDTLTCTECGEKCEDAQSFYNHLYKTGHKDTSYFEFPFDSQLQSIYEKHNLNLSEEEIDKLFDNKE